jgi:hypothetical protein
LLGGSGFASAPVNLSAQTINLSISELREKNQGMEPRTAAMTVRVSLYRLFQLDVNYRRSLPIFSRFTAVGAFGFVLVKKGDEIEVQYDPHIQTTLKAVLNPAA